MYCVKAPAAAMHQEQQQHLNSSAAPIPPADHRTLLEHVEALIQDEDGLHELASEL